MSWSLEVDNTTAEEFTERVDQYKGAVGERERQQVHLALSRALGIATDLGAARFYARIHGHAEAAAGPGDCLGVYVARRP